MFRTYEQQVRTIKSLFLTVAIIVGVATLIGFCEFLFWAYEHCPIYCNVITCVVCFSLLWRLVWSSLDYEAVSR
jgi:hypothetical protein